MACFTLVRTGQTLTLSLPFSLNQTPLSLPMMASLLTPVPLLPVSHGFSHIRSPATERGPFSLWPSAQQCTVLALNSPWRSGKKFPSLAVSRSLQIFSLLDGVRVTLSFGIGCLELASDTFVYVRFPYPEPGSAPQLEVKGWTLTPDCGSYFFSWASHSLGHLHPSRPGVVDPSDYARPASLLKWPATSPATRSRYAHLPHYQTPDAPPKLLPAASIPYYHMGMDQLCQPAVLHDKDLVPSLWLAAFAALIGISLTNEHNALLQHPLIPPQFPSRVIAPLIAGTSTQLRTTSLKSSPALVPRGQSKTDVPAVRAHSLPLTTHPFKSSRAPLWILSLPGLDDLYARISQLAVLIHDAQDLARSPSGWIKTSALIAYNGPSIPGNFDTQSGEIVNTSTFLLKVHGLSQPLTDEYIKGLVSKDNLRGPKRFLLGLYAPGKTTNSTQLVIRLTPIPAADPNAGAAGASSLRTSRPLTLDEAEPYGVCFFQSSMLRVLTREGIRPKKKSQPGRSSLLKVQPTDNPGPVGSSQLRGRSDACFLIDMHASIKAGTEWIMYTNDGCYGTDHIPITPQFLLVAFRFTPRGSEEIWSAHSSVAPAANTHTPTAFLPHSSSIGSAQQDSRADVRLRAHLHAPPATIIPAEDDDELLDATPDIDVPVSTAVSSALTHLEQAIDDMHSASPKPLSFDPLFYLALSSLPLTYPWPILTIDLKNFLPLMDRHVLTHLVAAQASVNPRFQHPAPVLGSFFKDLAHAVVHTILAPLNSQHMRPNLPPRVFTGEFWHAHFNYAALRTDPARSLGSSRHVCSSTVVLA